VFHGYQNLLNETSDVVVHEWAPDLNTRLENLSFWIISISIMIHCHCLEITLFVLVIRVFFQHTMNNVQMQCSQVATKVSDELEKQFHVQDVMDALGVVYPQYWLKITCESSFPIHMDVWKKKNLSP
jgi:hypothetical protein